MVSRKRLQHRADPIEASAVATLLDRAERAGGVGHWVWRGAKHSMEWSAGMRRILGVSDSRARASHERFLAAVHPDDRELIEQALASSLQNARGWQLAHRMQRIDGEERTVRTEVEFRAQPARLEGVVLDITDRLDAQRRLRELAHHDPFTCLLSRQHLIDQMAQAMSAAERSGTRVGLLYLDLDQFERIAETIGRECSEGVLIAVTERLSSGLRRASGNVRQGRVAPTVARVGSDEFVVVIPDLELPEYAARIGERMRELLAKPFLNGGEELLVTASCGVAIFPDDGRDPERLIEHAGIAMRESRGSGRVGFFSPEMRARAERTLRVESVLPGLVERGEVFLVLQPQVHAATLELAGAEALVRWTHPTLGAVTPDEFIPVAEGSEQIFAIGRFVLDSACREAARWTALSGRSLAIGVNVSARQLERPGLYEAVLKALHATGLSPALLHLEITETALIRKHGSASEVVRRLKQLGVKISLDDFGTGYSTLSHLARFEMDVVKIDKSFVAKLAEDPHQRAVVGAMIDLAHRLGAEVVAEGVETADQEAILREEGCDLLQGYRYSRPLSPDEFLARIQSFQPESLREEEK